MSFYNQSKMNTAATLMLLASVAVPNVASAFKLTFSREVAPVCEFKASSNRVKSEFGVGGEKGDHPVTFGVDSNTGKNNIRITQVEYGGANLAPTLVSSRVMNKDDFKIYVNGASAPDSMDVATAKKYSSDPDGNYNLWLTTTEAANKLKSGEQKVVMTIEADCS